MEIVVSGWSMCLVVYKKKYKYKPLHWVRSHGNLDLATYNVIAGVDFDGPRTDNVDNDIHTRHVPLYVLLFQNVVQCPCQRPTCG